MDNLLWSHGRRVADARQHPDQPWELDFLRGMHSPQALGELASYLSSKTGDDVELTSIWLDKTAWVSWNQTNGIEVDKRELADLAVIVRRHGARATVPWMWLVQAKRTQALLGKYSGTSTAHELDLLQRMPDFTLVGESFPFKLVSEFSPPLPKKSPSDWPHEVSTPWTFLDFDGDRAAKNSATARGLSPILARWTGVSPKKGTWAKDWQNQNGYAQPAVASYVRSLEAIITGGPLAWTTTKPNAAGKNFVPGAPVDKTFPEWSRLYDALLSTLSQKTTGHAGIEKDTQGEVVRVSGLRFMKFMVTDTISRGTRTSPGTRHFSWKTAASQLPDVHGAAVYRDFNRLNHPLSSLAPWVSANAGAPSRSWSVDGDESRGMQVLLVDVAGDEEFRWADSSW